MQTAAVASMPVFAAPTGKASSRASSWAVTMAGSTGAAARTAAGVCAVRAVIAESPQASSAAKVRRSTWIPAPPDGSEPAQVSAYATVIGIGSAARGMNLGADSRTLK